MNVLAYITMITIGAGMMVYGFNPVGPTGTLAVGALLWTIGCAAVLLRELG